MSLPRLLALPVLATVLAFVVVGCGGGGDSGADTSSQAVPTDAIAVVGETQISRAEYDRFFEQTEAAYKAQGREFPKVGSPEYEQLKSQAVDYLVQRVLLQREAASLGIEVTEADVQKKLTELVDQYFEGDKAKYQAEIKKQGLTEEDVQSDIRAQIINQRVFDRVTKGVTVTPDEIKKYYEDNKKDFTTPESRDVAHILVKTKKEAEDIQKQLDDGADFAELAKKYSQDTASAKDGGKLTDQKGSFVPEFEEVAFALDTGQYSDPTKTQFGWHIIKALDDTKAAATQSFDQVEAQIEEQLLQQKKNEKMNAWVSDVETKHAGEISYAVGFKPLADTGATSTSP
jgi:parvulin-like peptidyl-prolyl isomerase